MTQTLKRLRRDYLDDDLNVETMKMVHALMDMSECYYSPLTACSHPDILYHMSEIPKKNNIIFLRFLATLRNVYCHRGSNVEDSAFGSEVMEMGLSYLRNMIDGSSGAGNVIIFGSKFSFDQDPNKTLFTFVRFNEGMSETQLARSFVNYYRTGEMEIVALESTEAEHRHWFKL
jgi:hypothetical protein